MVMMSTLVATRGGAVGAGGWVQPQISVRAAAGRTLRQAEIGDQEFMKWFYCLCCQESGIVHSQTYQLRIPTCPR